MPIWRRVGTLLSCAVATAVPLGGCSAERAEPKAWARTVCTALVPWRTRIAELTTQAQQQIDRTKTPAQTKQQLTALLEGAEQASEAARVAVSAAGVPDSADGEAVAGWFVNSLTKVRDAYGRARITVTGLDPTTADPFYDAVGAAFAKLNGDYPAGAADPRAVQTGPLSEALGQVPGCR